MKKGHSKVVKILLENGATVDMQNNEGDTALLIASNEGYPEVARLLLKSCAQVDNIGRSALMLACSKGYHV